MTTTTLGALSVKITADSSGLKTGIKKANDALVTGRKSLNDNAASFAKWGAAGVAASAAIGVAIFKSQSAVIDQLAKTSDKIGITTEALAGLRFAAEQTGVSSNTLDMAMQRMVRRLSEASQGGGEAVKAIDELGLSAQDLANQSPDEALKTIADALEGVENQSDKVRLAFKFFDSEGVALVNTLAGGSEALNNFDAQARALGITLSRVDAAQVEQANDALNSASKLISGALQAATVELAPIVTAVANAFSNAGIEAGGFGGMARDSIDGVIDSIGFVMDAVEGVKRVFQVLGRSVALVVLGIEEGMLTVADAIVNTPIEAVNELIAALNSLPWHNIDPVELSGFGETIKSELDTVREAIQYGVDDIADILAAPMPAAEIVKAVEVARAASVKLAEETAKAKKISSAEDGKGKELAAPDVSTDTQALLDRFATEGQLQADKFAKDQERLDQALAKKEISEKTHAETMRALEAENSDAMLAIKIGKTAEETAAILEGMKARFSSERELEDQRFIEDQEALAAQREMGTISEAEHLALTEKLNQEHIDRLAAMEQAKKENQLQQASDTFGALATVMSVGGKKTEKAVRALSIAQAVIKGHESAVAAYAAGMATGGPAAPATAALYAAASIAQTGMMISKLKSGSKTPSRPNGRTPANALAATEGASGAGSNAPQQRIDISIGGEAFFTSDQVRSLIEQINEQTTDGVQLNATIGA